MPKSLKINTEFLFLTKHFLKLIFAQTHVRVGAGNDHKKNQRSMKNKQKENTNGNFPGWNKRNQSILK